MKVLLVNKHLYPKGGDAVSTLVTGRLLESKGHKVIFWGMEHPGNPDYPHKDLFVSHVDYDKPMGTLSRLKAAINILYSLEAKGKIDKLITEEKPDIIHLHNYAHQISPSILDAINKYKVPVVMTMHDYKLVCPTYALYLDGMPCERCRNGKYYWCILKRCAKESYLNSMLNTIEMYLHHKILNIYNLTDMYISPSMFLKNKIKEMGFKKEVEYLPNFINVDEYAPDYDYDNELCYFGRLSMEKGVNTLIEAVKVLKVGLKIIGNGPIENQLRQKVEDEKINNVRFLGYKTGDDLKNDIKKSIAVVIPSEWYENNPRAVLESFALGRPVIGSRIGGIPELVKDEETGLTFEPGDADDLRNKIEFLLRNPDSILKMGRNARKYIEEYFNPEMHYQGLIRIYQTAIDNKGR